MHIVPCGDLREVKHLVGSDTLLVFLICVHEVDDTVNDAKNATYATAETEDDVDDTTLAVAMIELVNTKSTQKDGQNTCSCSIFHTCHFFLAVEKCFKFVIRMDSRTANCHHKIYLVNIICNFPMSDFHFALQSYGFLFYYQ